MDDRKINEIGRSIIDAAIKVHSALGPGLLESAYEKVLSKELKSRGLSVASQVPISIRYQSEVIDDCFRADLIVEDSVLIELKSLESLADVHHKQLFTYLKLSGYKLGYLLNFGTPLMKDGIRRMVNGVGSNPARAR